MKKVGFIGAGNMAGALMKGLINAQLYTPQEMIVSDTLPAQLRKIKRRYQVEGTRENRTVVQQARTIVLAVKPQIIDQVLAEIQPVVTPAKRFISIAAGVTLTRLEKGLGGEARVIRGHAEYAGPAGEKHDGGCPRDQGQGRGRKTGPSVLSRGLVRPWPSKTSNCSTRSPD